MVYRTVDHMIMRLIVCTLSCALVFAFGLHAIDAHHTHPGEHGQAHDNKASHILSLSEYAHMSEKKMFGELPSVFVFAASMLSFVGVLRALCAALLHRVRMHLGTHNDRSVFSWERMLYAQGILEPKLH